MNAEPTFQPYKCKCGRRFLDILGKNGLRVHQSKCMKFIEFENGFQATRATQNIADRFDGGMRFKKNSN